MQTFGQLTPAQQVEAVAQCVNGILEDICNGALRFNDALNGDNLQDRIDAAFAKAERMHTPWFAEEYIMATCRDEIEGMAQCCAEDALYPEPGERCIYLKSE